ncbi:four helix bundle protein [Patescibacteria group bacterium]|nr:four helix bundle protein [Patescibacteria group bacterium]MBU1895529.1 four helix bundle protein [Patescibacteria group bacterium]
MEGQKKNYIEVWDLEAYKFARQYSKNGWKIYKTLDWQTKKIMGDQMIESVDSVGANIAEGYGRFHYLDKNKFYYNGRGSLLESRHWIGLLFEREFICQEEFNQMKELAENIEFKINSLIKSQLNSKKLGIGN